MLRYGLNWERQITNIGGSAQKNREEVTIISIDYLF
jgi:hypothetical protein